MGKYPVCRACCICKLAAYATLFLCHCNGGIGLLVAYMFLVLTALLDLVGWQTSEAKPAEPKA